MWFTKLDRELLSGLVDKVQIFDEKADRFAEQLSRALEIVVQNLGLYYSLVDKVKENEVKTLAIAVKLKEIEEYLQAKENPRRDKDPKLPYSN